ncbi:hypothetical protein [Fusobacterium periodonticum]|uniref:hypothetical protein n=1 Tax=Fusobacterium periodonticum TaxID=860 RepID=UPI0028D2EED9|nr:hypothetical protein [Fusobacterium periodonticum]
MAEENVKKEKNPLEKIAEMTTEMAKLVLVTQALSTIKGKDGQPKGFAEIGDEKLSTILGIDKSRIGGKNGLIYEAVMAGHICAANVKTNEPLLDQDGNHKLNSQGEVIMKSHRVLSSNMKGIEAGYKAYGVEVPEKVREKVDFKPKKEKDGLTR